MTYDLQEICMTCGWEICLSRSIFISAVNGKHVGLEDLLEFDG